MFLIVSFTLSLMARISQGRLSFFSTYLIFSDSASISVDRLISSMAMEVSIRLSACSEVILISGSISGIFGIDKFDLPLRLFTPQLCRS